MRYEQKSHWEQTLDQIFKDGEERIAELEKVRDTTHPYTAQSPYFGYGTHSSPKTANRQYIDDHYNQKIAEVRSETANKAIDAVGSADKATKAEARVRTDRWLDGKPAMDMKEPKDITESQATANQRRKDFLDRSTAKTDHPYNINTNINFKAPEKAGENYPASSYNIKTSINYNQAKDKQVAGSKEEAVKQFAEQTKDIGTKATPQPSPKEKTENVKQDFASNFNDKGQAPKVNEPKQQQFANNFKAKDQEPSQPAAPKSEPAKNQPRPQEAKQPEKEKSQQPQKPQQPKEPVQPTSKSHQIKQEFAHQRWEMLTKESNQSSPNVENSKNSSHSTYERWNSIAKGEDKGNDYSSENRDFEHSHETVDVAESHQNIDPANGMEEIDDD